eukprot:GILK01004652.1.p1 GENE.GILK01004652.1~~GILK01004652.1.p1  ORF type:complete len:535 (+),score=60.10 GILK01004652.1:42-1646(+)
MASRSLVALVSSAYTRGSQKPLTFYVLTIKHGTEEWTLEKRFSDFDVLHAQLKKRCVSLPALPGKTVFRSTSPEFVESRRRGLDAYLQSLIQQRDALASQELADFLELGKHAPSLPSASSKAPVQVGDIPDTGLAVTDFTYLPHHGIIFVALADMSPTSRMDSYLTNIQMPWEKNNTATPSIVAIGGFACYAQTRNTWQFDKLWTQKLPQQAFTLSWDETTQLLAVGQDKGKVNVHRVPVARNFLGHEELWELDGHTARVMGLAIDPYQNRLFSISRDKHFRAYDISADPPVCLIDIHVSAHPLYSLLLDSQNQRAVIGAENGFLYIYDLVSFPPRHLLTLNGHTGPIRSLYLDPKTNYLFSGSFDSTVRVWTLGKQGKERLARDVAKYAHGKRKIRAVCYCPSSRELLSGTENGQVTIWDSRSGQAEYVLQAHAGPVTKMVWMDGDRRLITASKDKCLKIWDFPRVDGSTRSSSADFVIEEGNFGSFANDVSASNGDTSPASTALQRSNTENRQVNFNAPLEEKSTDLAGWWS